jgi:hypothetical protein
MDNPVKLETLDTQDTWQRQTQQKHNIICVGHPIHKTKGEYKDVFVTQNKVPSHLYQKPIN